MHAPAPVLGEKPFVPIKALEDAVEGREEEVLAALGIVPPAGNTKHIRCPYPDHEDKKTPSWRWDRQRRRAICTCSPKGLSILNVATKMLRCEPTEARVFVAERIGRSDLIRSKGRGTPKRAQERDDTLVATYLASRLVDVEPAEVFLPTTDVIGLKQLDYYDDGRKIGAAPALVFTTVDRDDHRHAHRIWTGPNGHGKADFGRDDRGEVRSPKKSAKKKPGQGSTAGLSVLWGDPGKATTILVSEGIETGLAIAQAMRAEIMADEVCVAAAISAAGMQAFRPWPATRRVIVMADTDPSRAGEKAARAFAMAHREAIAIAIALPQELHADGTDWLNIYIEAGDAAVREGVEDAEPFVPAAEELEAERKRKAEEKGIAEAVAAVGGMPWVSAVQFGVHRRGERIWFYKIAESKQPLMQSGTVDVATLFGITARLCRLEEDGREVCGLRVVVQGHNGTFKEVDLWPSQEVERGGAEVLRLLKEAGLRLGPSGRNDVLAIIAGADPEAEITILKRPGCHRLAGRDPIYVAPDGTIVGAEAGRRIELDMAVRLPPHAARAGTLDGWKTATAVAVDVEDCPHWALGLMVGFAGPLVDLLQLPTMGLVLTGQTSTGKTTALELAVSAWSSPDVRAGGLAHAALSTTNAIEGLAEAATGSLLVLDELKNLDSKGVTALLYKLGGSAGKARLTSNADPRKIRSWRTFAILSSEMGVRALVERDGGGWQGGMAVRLADIALDGINRNVPAATFAKMRGIRTHFGVAGIYFVESLFREGLDLDALSAAFLGLRAKLLAGTKDQGGALERAADPFAIVWLAGCLAQRYRLIPATLDVEAVVHWAWGLFRESGSAAILAPVDEAIRHLQARILEAWDSTIRDPKALGGARDAIGWYDATAVYIPKGRLFELAGGVLDANALAREFGRRGLIAARKGRQLTVDYVRSVGRVDAYALSRTAFGKGSSHADE